ncbi:hypothetical protein WV31_19115 [Magnetospirillum sp. ME-1]|nr:hypothetical protein WV31_19115 [Magnetospirillum sp. ME-1]
MEISMTDLIEKARERRVRHQLARKGYGLIKSRARRDDDPEKGLYMVYRFTDQMAMTRGYHAHSETLEDVESLAAEIAHDPCWC